MQQQCKENKPHFLTNYVNRIRFNYVQIFLSSLSNWIEFLSKKKKTTKSLFWFSLPCTTQTKKKNNNFLNFSANAFLAYFLSLALCLSVCLSQRTVIVVFVVIMSAAQTPTLEEKTCYMLVSGMVFVFFLFRPLGCLAISIWHEIAARCLLINLFINFNCGSADNCTECPCEHDNCMKKKNNKNFKRRCWKSTDRQTALKKLIQALWRLEARSEIVSHDPRCNLHLHPLGEAKKM